jgi:hypothetical protein
MADIRILARKAVKEWLEGVRYPVTWTVCSWSTSIGSQIRHVLHERAAAFYARQYFDEHGRLPEGTHHVTLRVGPSSGRNKGDIRHPYGSPLIDSERTFAAEITYPPILLAELKLAQHRRQHAHSRQPGRATPHPPFRRRVLVALAHSRPQARPSSSVLP